MAILEEIVESPEIDLSGDGGVMKKILVEGAADDSGPCPQCKVRVQYTGWKDGEKFDSTVERDKPFEFVLHRGMTIEGFDLGITSMKKGEKAQLTIQAGYAIKPGRTTMDKMMPTGDDSEKPEPPPPILPDVPENMMREDKVVFEVELLEWKPGDLTPREKESDADEYIVRHVVRKPRNWSALPNDGSTVTVHLTGKYKGREFDDREVTFVLGETDEEEVILGIQEALIYFGKGEISRLVIRPDFAFGKEGNEKFQIQPNATVEYTVKLKDFKKVPDGWKMKAKESFDEATRLKNKGTEFLNKGKYIMAIKIYQRAKDLRMTLAKDEFHVKLLLNIALCHLKLKNFAEAKQTCDEIIKLDEKCVKAYFRRGQALLGTHDPDSALKDFEKAHTMRPLDKSIPPQIEICKKEVKKLDAQEKQLFARMMKK